MKCIMYGERDTERQKCEASSTEIDERQRQTIPGSKLKRKEQEHGRVDREKKRRAK